MWKCRVWAVRRCGLRRSEFDENCAARNCVTRTTICIGRFRVWSGKHCVAVCRRLAARWQTMQSGRLIAPLIALLWNFQWKQYELFVWILCQQCWPNMRAPRRVHESRNDLQCKCSTHQHTSQSYNVTHSNSFHSLAVVEQTTMCVNIRAVRPTMWPISCAAATKCTLCTVYTASGDQLLGQTAIHSVR